ncbi:MAG: ABC transporter permease [Planctomycetes bacterium]|nr:ABC transporter permease [Planctomycetota bacterium]
MRMRVVRAVARTTFREFWRSPEAVFWTYGFPILMAVVLGFSFRPGPLPKVPVAVVDGPQAAAMVAALGHDDRLQVERLDAAAADRALARGRVAVLVRAEQPAVLRADPTRPDAELARLLVERTLRDAAQGPPPPLAVEAETRPGARYIDFLIPGLIGLNLLGAGMWGVGFQLVQMRTHHLLRRLAVTPMRRSEFVAGYLAGRLALVLPEALAITLFGTLLWDVPFRGGFLPWTCLVLVGSFAFAGLGCLLAARVRTIEAVAGLMNAAQLPMWVLGGTFFANERLEGVMHWAAEVMPLTHLNRALRDVMLEPGTLLDVAWPLAALAAFAAACFGLALRFFRWQ